MKTTIATLTALTLSLIVITPSNARAADAPSTGSLIECTFENRMGDTQHLRIRHTQNSARAGYISATNSELGPTSIRKAPNGDYFYGFSVTTTRHPGYESCGQATWLDHVLDDVAGALSVGHWKEVTRLRLNSADYSRSTIEMKYFNDSPSFVLVPASYEQFGETETHSADCIVQTL